ncbi:Ubiquitin-like protein [Dioscorea alata]|uniref:Ubiquitin-like protein n=1 Tax=Dioscorea alata TaxID=55571 RepID=A0ACB7TY89_DIOAL|nr:Ubiquitin-like protein [Dioscorea alata]
MDVIIENKKDGTSFELEIWFSSTVLEIKEKIHKYHDVPVDKQTLYIRGAAMENDQDTVYYEVAQGSKIELVVHQDDQEEEQESLDGGGDEVMETEDDNVVNQDEEEIQEGLVGGHEVVEDDVVGQDEQDIEEGLVGGHEVASMEDVLGQQEGLKALWVAMRWSQWRMFSANKKALWVVMR